MRVESRNRRVPRAPLPVAGVTRSRGDLQGRLRGHYSSFLAQTGSCVRPSPSRRLGGPSYAGCLAGCRQSLLGDGPSRHYLCNPCVGAWTHTPAASLECTCPFLPREHRPHASGRCVRHAKLSLQCNVNREPYFGAAVIRIFRLLRSLGPQIASTAASSCWAAGPFTPRIARVVTHSGMWHRYVSDLGN